MTHERPGMCDLGTPPYRDSGATVICRSYDETNGPRHSGKAAVAREREHNFIIARQRARCKSRLKQTVVSI